MSYCKQRLAELKAKKPRESPRTGQLTEEGMKIAKQADRSLVNPSEVARTLDVPTNLITQLWRNNGQSTEE